MLPSEHFHTNYSLSHLICLCTGCDMHVMYDTYVIQKWNFAMDDGFGRMWEEAAAAYF